MRINFMLRSGALEAVKWLALVLMTGDHVNKYLFNGTLPVLFEAGRVALPLFVFVLAYNLSRDNAINSGVYSRVKKHLFIFGCLALLPYYILGGGGGGLFPLNILFTLLVITIVVENLDKHRLINIILAAFVFVVGGGFVEYWWPAIFLGVSSWWFFKSRNLWSAGVAVGACGLLYFINGNFWALLAIPIFIGASGPTLEIPRLRWIFYVYYPAHLLAFVLIRIPLKNAGYIFL